MPRHEEAREAVLRAVDDLLVEIGYAAMTMKGIAERAGVGRQTVYRWWTTKAEILFEASVEDAAQHDRAVAQLLATRDILGDSARTALRTTLRTGNSRAEPTDRALDEAVALLVGPVYYWIVGGHDPRRLRRARIIASARTALRSPSQR